MTEYLDVPGGRIAYDVAGTGRLVVCAPGMGDIRQSYRLLTPLLVDAGFRVATMDIRGNGDSRGDWPSYTQADIGRDMLALIRHLGGPAIAIGQSFTPDSALVAAVEGQEQVDAVVLIAPWATEGKMNPVLRMVQDAVLRVPALWGMFYASLYPGTKPADFAEYLRTLKASLRGPGGTAGLIAMSNPASKDGDAYRSRVTQPALVVMGEKDPDFPDPRAEAQAMADAVAGPSTVTMVPDAGHYPHAQAPAATAAAILSFAGALR